MSNAPLLAALTTDELKDLDPAPKKFRQAADENQGLALVAIRNAMAGLVVANLPPELEGNVLYPPFLGGKAREWMKEKPNLAVHVARHRNEEPIQGIIAETGRNAARKLIQEGSLETEQEAAVVHNLRVAINSALRKGLEELNDSNIIYINPKKRCTPRQAASAVEEITHALDRGEIEPELAAVAVFWKLGAFSDEELQNLRRKKEGVRLGRWRARVIREHVTIRTLDDLNKFKLKPLAEELHESLVWAREFLARKIKTRIKPLITRQVAVGTLKGPIKYPSFNETLRGEDFFPLLKALFGENSTPENANDAQILVNFALIHWIFSRRSKDLRHAQKIDDIDHTIERELFEMEEGKHTNREVVDQGQKILAYDEANRSFKETGATYDARCRVLKTSHGYEDIPETQRLVFLDNMGAKTVESSVIKHFNPDRTNRDLDDMPDEVRTRLVAWNVSSRELEQNPRLKDFYTQQLSGIAQKLGLNRSNVEDELSHEHFPKLTLSGKNKDGINVEVQLLPIDTYQFAEADGSWFDHEKLEEMRDLETLLPAIPYSVSPVSHKVGYARVKEIKQKRNECKAARKAFLAQAA